MMFELNWGTLRSASWIEREAPRQDAMLAEKKRVEELQSAIAEGGVNSSQLPSSLTDWRALWSLTAPPGKETPRVDPGENFWLNYLGDAWKTNMYRTERELHDHGLAVADLANLAPPRFELAVRACCAFKPPQPEVKASKPGIFPERALKPLKVQRGLYCPDR